MKLTDGVLNLDESPFMVDGKPATFRTILIFLLGQATPNMPGEKKYDLYCLSRRIQQEDEIMFTASEVKLIRAQAGELGVPIIVGRIWDALDADELGQRALRSQKA